MYCIISNNNFVFIKLILSKGCILNKQYDLNKQLYFMLIYYKKI